MPKCDGCPADCLGQTSHPFFCAWWASGDANLRRHVEQRSAIGHVERAPAPVADPTPAARPPGLLTKIGNLARAIVEHTVAGFPATDAATAAARLATCRACPDMTPGGGGDGGGMTCNRCGCAMQVKVWMAEQECPIGKWRKAVSVPLQTKGDP